MRLPLAALALATAGLPADGAVRNIPVPAFAKLRVDGPSTVRVRTGGPVSVKASGPQARLDKLLVESRGNMLVVSTEKGWNWRGMSWGKEDMIIVEISVPMLEAAELTGSGELSVDKVRTSAFTALLTGSGDLHVGRLDSGRLTATLTGSGDLSLSGKTGRAEMSVNGSGDLRAPGLSVNLLTANLLGSGDIDVGSTGTARAKVMGSGDIRIGGRPHCTTSKMGSGEIKCGS